MKKILSLLLALSIIFVVAACGNGEDPSSDLLTSTPDSSNNETSSSETDETSSENTSSQQDDNNSSDFSSSTQSQNQSGGSITVNEPLKVLNMPFESVLYSNGNLICGKVNGYYGAINISGKTIVPFEYTGINAPSSDGYIVATKRVANSDVYNNYLYDSTGKIVYESKGEYVYDVKIDDKDIHTMSKGELMLVFNGGVLLTFTNYIDSGANPTYTLNLRKPNGALIKSFDNVTGYAGFNDGNLAISFDSYYENDTLEYPYIWVVNTVGEMVYSYKYEGFADAPLIAYWDSDKKICGGYFAAHLGVTPVEAIFSKDLKNIYKCETIDYDNPANRLTYKCHYVTKVVFKTQSGKYKLIDISKVPEYEFPLSIPAAIISKYDYDSMSFFSYYDNKENYALVSRNDKWGFLSLDGKTEKLYDDAGYFFNGRAIVKQGNEIYIINEKFEKISNTISGYASVSTLGNNIYCVKSGNKYYIAVFKP